MNPLLLEQALTVMADAWRLANELATRIAAEMVGETGSGEAAMRTEPLPESSPDRLLVADEAAALLALPVSWVREATRQGELPHVKLGRYRRYVRADLLAWMKEHKA